MRIHHYGINAMDTDKSLDFYTRVLGFKQEETIVLGGQNFYFVGDGNICIEIEKAWTPGASQFDNGLSHMALAVDDLEDTAARLKAEGVKFLVEPSQFRPDRKIAFIEDPDGVKIQLIEFLSTQNS